MFHGADMHHHMTPRILVDINGYAVARDDRSREYVVYVITITQSQYKWTVFRRYATFHTLSDLLMKRAPYVIAPVSCFHSIHIPAVLYWYK